MIKISDQDNLGEGNISSASVSKGGHLDSWFIQKSMVVETCNKVVLENRKEISFKARAR